MPTLVRQHQRFSMSDSRNNHDNVITYYQTADRKFNATLVFTYESFVNEWVQPEDGSAPVLFRGATLPDGPEINVNLNEHQHSSNKKLIEIVQEELQHWRLRTNLFYQFMFNNVIPKAREAYRLMPGYCYAMKIYFPMNIVYDRVYDEMRGMDMAILQSQEEARTHMVPAAQCVIESLKRVELVADSGDQCMICLEEMIKGRCEAVTIPCSHVFHEDCIKQWFSTSHYCPLCRFEMPTDCSN